MTQVTRRLEADAAFKLHVKHSPLKYTVSEKFKDDHTMIDRWENLSKRTSITEAIKRYKQNQRITVSSWMLMDARTIINKVRDAKKWAHVYQNSQQMTVPIMVTRRTVTIERLDPKQSHRYEHEKVEIRGETHCLNCTSTEETLTIQIMGPWDPLTGEVTLYHYAEGNPPNGHALLDRYLKWICENGEPIRPSARR